MIKKLKIRFICLAMAALFIVLAISVIGMNVINYATIVKDADAILTFLSGNKGEFPEMDGNVMQEHKAPDAPNVPDAPDTPKAPDAPRPFSPETPYESRYFSVLIDAAGKIIRVDTSRIFSVDSEKAGEYAEKVFSSGKESGFTDEYRYLQSNEGSNTRIIFLDCGRKLDGFYTYLWISIGMTIAGLVVMFFVIVFFAGKIVRPIAESYEKQKRFITDAGHEIKTPLTIINANVDLLEDDPEDADCLHDIRQQAERLTTLTNDLVYLARMEEADRPLEMTDLVVSDMITEAAAAFRGPALIQEKEFVCQIQPGLFMKGNDKAIRQLINILMDNALKYSPEGGRIAIHFGQNRRSLQLDICNTTETAVNGKELEHVFDRFYRMDPSRNSATGGHGIGLSVAKAIVEAHHGTIRAWQQDSNSFHITCNFPV